MPQRALVLVAAAGLSLDRRLAGRVQHQSASQRARIFNTRAIRADPLERNPINPGLYIGAVLNPGAGHGRYNSTGFIRMPT